MNIYKNIVSQGSKIKKELKDIYKEMGASETHGIPETFEDKSSFAVSNKTIQIERITQILQFYNEQEIKEHSDHLKNNQLESFYSNLLIEQQHFYENEFKNEINLLKEERKEQARKKIEFEEEKLKLDNDRIKLEEKKSLFNETIKHLLKKDQK